VALVERHRCANAKSLERGWAAELRQQYMLADSFGPFRGRFPLCSRSAIVRIALIQRCCSGSRYCPHHEATVILILLTENAGLEATRGICPVREIIQINPDSPKAPNAMNISGDLSMGRTGHDCFFQNLKRQSLFRRQLERCKIHFIFFQKAGIIEFGARKIDTYLLGYLTPRRPHCFSARKLVVSITSASPLQQIGCLDRGQKIRRPV